MNDLLYFEKGFFLCDIEDLNKAVNNIQKAIQMEPISIYFKNLGIIINFRIL